PRSREKNHSAGSAVRLSLTWEKNRKKGRDSMGVAAFACSIGTGRSALRARLLFTQAVGRGGAGKRAELAQCRLHAGSIRRIGLRAVVDVALLDEVRRVAHRARGVVEQQLLLVRCHQPEQVARLLVVVGIVVAEIPPVGVAGDLQRRLAELRLFLPLVEAVGLIVEAAAVVAVDPSDAVAMVAVDRAARGVDRDLL